MGRACRATGALLIVLVITTGCSFTQTPFARTADDVAATLAAAAASIEYDHQGKLTDAYARGSFVGFREALGGVETSLPALGGAPDEATVRRLIERLRAVRPILSSPCLDNRCDWDGQVQALRGASDAFKGAADAATP